MFHDCPSLTDHEYSYHYAFVYCPMLWYTVMYANINKTYSFYSHQRVPKRYLKNIFARCSLKSIGKDENNVYSLIAWNFINMLEVRN